MPLNKVGPDPWDYEYKPEVGERVTFVALDGEAFTEVITAVDDTKAMGEVGFIETEPECTCDQWPGNLPHWHVGAMTDDEL